MTMLSSFTTTADWQELTGVSGVAGIFTLQNIGSNKAKFFLHPTTTPTTEKGMTLGTVGNQTQDSSVRIDNTTNTEKVWVKSEIATDSTEISINEV